MARKTASAGAADPRARVVDAAFRIAARDGWVAVDAAAIARSLKLTQAEVTRLVPDRAALLVALNDKVDGEVVAGLDPDLLREPPRDRLFETLMRRFELLEPYREGLRTLNAECRSDPLLASMLAAGLLLSMRRMLEVAGLGGTPWTMLIHVKALTAIWVYTARTWFADDTEDRARTMAVLDRALERAEGLARSIGLIRSPAR
ncbi:MAG: hypothetical protein WD270_04765 [Acetobacterales bacterium]